MESGTSIPTPFEWLGGTKALERLFAEFYAKVPNDPLLAPAFAAMPPDHSRAVAAFVGEVHCTCVGHRAERGGHPAMIRHHVGRSLTEAQRKRWVGLLLECADAVGLPDDPEFRSAFVAYIEWGSRLAVINSAPSAQVDDAAPMPKWGWGEVKGPYVAPK